MEASSVGTLQNKLSSPLDKGKRILLGLDIDFFDFNPRLGRFGLATVIDATYSARHTPRAAEGRAGFNTRPPRTRAWCSPQAPDRARPSLALHQLRRTRSAGSARVRQVSGPRSRAALPTSVARN